jgi:hypothetical protein
MTKGEIVGNIFVIDVKDKGSLHMSKINITSLQDVQDKYCKMDIVESITFGFLMISLDTLYLKEFLPYIPSSNGSTSYMVGNIILRPFQWYMAFPLTP